jgi:hypothetical protein
MRPDRLAVQNIDEICIKFIIKLAISDDSIGQLVSGSCITHEFSFKIQFPLVLRYRLTDVISFPQKTEKKKFRIFFRKTKWPISKKKLSYFYFVLFDSIENGQVLH